MPGSVTDRKSFGSKTFTRIGILLAAVMVFVGVMYLAIGAYAAGMITQIGPHAYVDDPPASYGIEYQDVRFPARGDGTHIAARFLPNGDGARAVILVHGREASKQNAITGNLVKLGAALHDAGLAVLMIDMRGHGESEGERFSFGVYERQDVLGAVDFLVAQGARPGSIGVLGISMGSGAAIGAAAEEPAIGALVLDSAFADLALLIEERWEADSGMPMLMLPGVFLMNRILNGYDLKPVQPVMEIVQVPPRPILILHCETDEMVGVWHAETLLEAVPSAQYATFDVCEHAEIYRDQDEAYETLVVSFFDESLK